MQGKMDSLCKAVDAIKDEMGKGFRSLEEKLPTQCAVHKQRLDDLDGDVGECQANTKAAHQRLDRLPWHFFAIAIPILIAIASGIFFILMHLSAAGG